MPSDGPAHFVVIPMAAWGHVRPLLHLAINLLTVHEGLHLTLLLFPEVAEATERELRSPSFAHVFPKSSPPSHESDTTLAASPPHTNKAVSSRFQLFTVDIQEQTQKDTGGYASKEMDEHAQTRDVMLGYLSWLFAQKGDNYRGNTNSFSDLYPSFAIFDIFESYIPDMMTKAVQALGQRMIPLIGFLPSGVAATWNHLASAEKGGVFEIMKIKVAEDIARGVDPLEAYSNRGFEGYGNVVQAPGMPSMYDWEIYPNIGSVSLPPQVMQQIFAITQAARHSALRAMVLTVPPELEVGNGDILQEELGKEVILAGMQFPATIWQGTEKTKAGDSEDDRRVISFLDRMERKYGTNSVFYVSFGSAFFPTLRPELVVYLLDSLIDHSIPFLFARASFLEQLDQDFLDRINNGDDSMEVKLAPQWAVLDHPATGYFVTHCGSNSVAEAIMTEQVIAAFPFAADEGEFAAMLVQLGCAIDLKQVKTPKPRSFTRMYDGTEIVGTEEAIKAEMADVWPRMRGEDGKRMRENTRKVKTICKESWQSGGSRAAMESFSKYF